MDRAELLAWLTVHRAVGGTRAAASFLAAFPDPRMALDASGALLAPVLEERTERLLELRRQDLDQVFGKELAWLDAPDHHAVVWGDADYPPLLREIGDPPALLFVLGHRAALTMPQFAIVGSRNPTPGGCDNARAFAEALARAGIAVTSGLALGIDACAHEGALAVGRTVAVVATGLDRVYPARHHDLAHRIAGAGAMVSEFFLGAPPAREHFPRRNRLISGMSVGVLVVEAALRSGSLITARLGADQGREVFAIPGSIHSPLARGCHALIRQGAKLVETAQDILEELAPLLRAQLATVSAAVPAATAIPPEFAPLADVLGFDPIDVDSLCLRSGLTPEGVSSMLLKMELRGWVTSLPGGKVQRSR